MNEVRALKVGILTFHRAINSGAVLQAYALQKCINDLGFDCEIVDYRCKAIDSAYKLFHVPISMKSLLSDLVNYYSRRKKKNKFNTFIKNEVNLSSKSYYRNNIDRMDDEYDCFFVGSDQVWNEELTGKDKTYFLDFCDRWKKNSYAASVGSRTIDERHKRLFSRMLNDYNSLSLREKSSVDILSSILNKEIEQSIDPVFLLHRKKWNQLSGRRLEKKPYIFAYCLHESDVYTQAKKLAEEMGIRVICVPFGRKCGIKAEIRRSLGPQDFINYIKNSEAVVSDSFHAVAFSLIYNKCFIAVKKKQYFEQNERVDSLLQLFGLQRDSRYVGNEEFLRVNKTIDIERKKATCYLLDAINRSLEHRS